MPSLTITIDDEIQKIIARRAKKNLLTLREQIEEIVRQSAVRTKSGQSAGKMSTDDRLVEIFSRNRKTRR
jgi:hypothetical protein